MANGNLLHRWFIAHPRSVDETYLEHLGVAGRFGFKLIAGGVACMVHAVFPNAFVRTGSNTVKGLYSEMISRQPGAPRPAYDAPEWRPEYEI
jgi:hypothetical protein